MKCFNGNMKKVESLSNADLERLQDIFRHLSHVCDEEVLVTEEIIRREENGTRWNNPAET